MTTIKQFDRATCKALNAEVAVAVAAIAAKYGLTVAPAGGSFDNTTYKAKVEFKVTDDAAVRAAEIKTIADMGRYIANGRLTVAHHGKEFTAGGKRYAFRGFGTRAKYPIAAFDIAANKMVYFGEVAAAHIVAAA